MRDIGSHIQLTYSISDPNKYRIKEYFDDAEYCEIETFTRIEDGKFKKLSYCNGILGRHITEPDGSYTSASYSAYKMNGDTLEVFSLFKLNQVPEQRLVRQAYSKTLVYLVDLETGGEYRRQMTAYFVNQPPHERHSLLH
jgi:hypothetical protein